MLFQKSIPVPLSTTSAAPLRTTVQITKGTLRHVWVRWRWGTGYLCGCRIKYHEFQYWPLSMTEWFVSHVETFDFAEDFDISDDPSELVVEAYNDDDSNPHTLWVAFLIDRGVGQSRMTEAEMAQVYADLGVSPYV